MGGIVQDPESSQQNHESYTAPILAAVGVKMCVTHPLPAHPQRTGHKGQSKALLNIPTQAILATYTRQGSLSFGFCVQVRWRRPHVLYT